MVGRGTLLKAGFVGIGGDPRLVLEDGMRVALGVSGMVGGVTWVLASFVGIEMEGVEFGRDAWSRLVLVFGVEAGDGCVGMAVSLAMVCRMASRSCAISMNPSAKRHGRIER